jgi:hypothetical protein
MDAIGAIADGDVTTGIAGKSAPVMLHSHSNRNGCCASDAWVEPEVAWDFSPVTVLASGTLLLEI